MSPRVALAAMTHPGVWGVWCEVWEDESVQGARFVAESWEDASQGGGIDYWEGPTPEEARDTGDFGPHVPPPALGEVLDSGTGTPTEWEDGSPLDYPLGPGVPWRIYSVREGWRR